MNLVQVADELYGLPPHEFTAARNEQARRAKSARDRELAEAIAKLRRPTVSAWLVNLLVREEPGLTDSLLELGESLRDAQQALAGDELRELSARRRELVTQLAQAAKRLAARRGQQVSAQVEREVTGTFDAALASPDAASAVRSGRLTAPLSYAGLGGIDTAEAVAVPLSPQERSRPPRRERPAGTARGTGGARPAAEPAAPSRKPAAARQAKDELAARRKAREAAQAEAELRAAEDEVREAEAGLADAEEDFASARDRQRTAAERIEDLEQQLAQAQSRDAAARRSLRQARRDREEASRALTAAQRRLARAQAKAKPRP